MDVSAMQYMPAIEASAIDELLKQWQNTYPEMGVLALLPEAEKATVPTLQQACAARGVTLVGAVFPALTESGAFRSQGVWLLRFDRMPYAALYPDLPRDEDALQASLDGVVNGLMPHLDGDGVTLFMLFDAMVPNIGTILDELYLRLANRVRYMGANAGSETFQPMPCLFDHERIVQNGVLLMLLSPHHGAILEHGYGVPEQMITATSTEGNRILQIDWRPAFEVYQELARAQYGVEIDRDNFYQYAVHFPFGIVRANGVIVVRIPVALEEDGSLFCVGEVPANAVLTLLRAPEVDSVHTLETMVNALTELNGPLDGRELLVFYCAGRRLHLGIDAATAELQGLQQRTAAGRIAGALSLGEIGSGTQWGYPLFHNATLVASAWQG
ncbi:MAG TPA: FIST C-terminal domain-containing protein [Mariprofundaceae bacterium]|nr:FIST C-terminal domain-containing protein [Mariprofundaceae bacterium]